MYIVYVCIYVLSVCYIRIVVVRIVGGGAGRDSLSEEKRKKSKNEQADADDFHPFRSLSLAAFLLHSPEMSFEAQKQIRENTMVGFLLASSLLLFLENLCMPHKCYMIFSSNAIDHLYTESF